MSDLWIEIISTTGYVIFWLIEIVFLLAIILGIVFGITYFVKHVWKKRI